MHLIVYYQLFSEYYSPAVLHPINFPRSSETQSTRPETRAGGTFRRRQLARSVAT